MKKIFITLGACFFTFSIIVGGLFICVPTRKALLDYVKNEVTKEITDGRDGINGLDGRDGQDGKDGINGLDGKDGQDGKDGINGLDGKDGINGLDGKDGINGLDGKDGINGLDGKDGQDGKDGKDGANGLDGKDGQDGANGLDGKDGQDGKDGKDGQDGANYFYIPDYVNGTTLSNQNNVSNASVTVNQTGFVYVYFQCSGGKEMTVKINGATVSQINANCGVLLPVAAGSIVTVTGGATGTITITYYPVLVLIV